MPEQWLGEMREWIDRKRAGRAALEVESNPSKQVLIRLESSQDDVWLCVPPDWQIGPVFP